MEHVYFDLETTGYNGLDILSDYNRIIQIGALCDRFEYERYVNPGVPIPRASTNIHGITDIKVIDAPPFNVVWEELLRIIGGRKCYIIAHGGKFFDRVMLVKELKRFGMEFDTTQFTFIDTDPIFRHVIPHAQSHNLGNMVRTFMPDYIFNNEHTAIADCKALWSLVMFMNVNIEQYNVDNTYHSFKKLYELGYHKWLLKEYTGVETTSDVANKFPSFIIYKWIKNNIPGISREKISMTMMRIYNPDTNSLTKYMV